MTCLTIGRLLTGLEKDIELDGQGKAKYLPPTPRLPYSSYSPPVGCFLAPHRCPYCDDIFPLPVYSETDPEPPPGYHDLFPPGYTPFPNPNTHLHPSFRALPPSIPLDPHLLHMTPFCHSSISRHCCSFPSWNDPELWYIDAGSDWDL